MAGSTTVVGFSEYTANGLGGYLMKKLCSFWGSLANASLAVKDILALVGFGVEHFHHWSTQKIFALYRISPTTGIGVENKREKLRERERL